MKNEEICRLMKEAFFEGYSSFATPACAYNTVEEAWEESDAKKVHDSLLPPPDFAVCFDCTTRDSCAGEKECYKRALGDRV